MYRFIDTTTPFLYIERTPLPVSEDGAGASVFEGRSFASEETASYVARFYPSPPPPPPEHFY